MRRYMLKKNNYEYYLKMPVSVYNMASNSNLSKSFLFLITCLLFFISANAQNKRAKATPPSVSPPLVVPDTSRNTLLVPVTIKDTGKNNQTPYLTLQQCIDYALQHQPNVNISLINVDVARATN